MLKKDFINQVNIELESLASKGLLKSEHEIITSQSCEIEINLHESKNLSGSKKKVLNFCANNYLGLANNNSLIDVAVKATKEYGLGAGSVRFICGTFDIHKKFESKMAEFLGFEDVITFSSCYAANGGVFAGLFDENDAIISADINHPSLIDGIMLCKAKHYFYKYDDMKDLEKKLKDAKLDGYRNILVATAGVFSMDGEIAKLPEICDLVEKHEAVLLVDDSHATGFIGKNGRGTPEHCGVEGRVDILVGTLGKALGGSSGGYVASKKLIVEKLRNSARTYLFSNNILPMIAAVGIETIDMIKSSKILIEKLAKNTIYFRQKICEAGFKIHNPLGIHPIVPVMLNDEILTAKFAKLLFDEEGIYVAAISFPAVPKNEARIRVQISAAHEKEHLDAAIAGFVRVAEKLNILN